MTIFFFTDTATTEIYTLSLHDALPISFTIGAKSASVTPNAASKIYGAADPTLSGALSGFEAGDGVTRSEEHTSELQSHHDLVCRLLLEKKKKNTTQIRSWN